MQLPCLSRLSCLLGLCIAAGHAALAQGTTPVRLEPVEIVGSHLKRVDQEGPAPVTVIGRDEIDASGALRLGDLLLAHPLAGAGGFDDRSTGFGAQFGAAGLSLRGLGAAATLILLNGRRLASYGVMLDDDSSFVDLNSLPLGAVERIEILRDGASAIYGADAIGGVVNIVLRSDFRGVEIALHGGGTTRGGAGQQGLRLGAGAGDLAADGWNVFGVLDASRQHQLGYTQRGFSRSGDQRRRGGTDVRPFTSFPPNYVLLDEAGNLLETPQSAPGCPPERLSPAVFGNKLSCRFEIAPYTDLVPASERASALAVASFAPNATTRVFAELIGTRNEVSMRQSPSVASSRLPPGDPRNPPDAQGNPVDAYVATNWRVMGEPRARVATVEFLSATVGGEGLVAGWDWRLAAGGSRIHTRSRHLNQVRNSLLSAAVARGEISPFDARLDPAVVAAVTADAEDRYRGGSDFVLAKASTDVARLAHGPLALATGVELRRETWRTRLDPLTLSGDIGSANNLGTDDAAAQRRVDAAFVELNWPLAPRLELQIAARHDRYDDYGASTSPKLALRWRVAAPLVLRASIGRGFLPPSLVQVNKPRSGFDDWNRDPARCPDPADDGLNCVYEFQHLQEGNPALRAERSRQHNLGLVFEPRPGTSVAVDFWRVAHIDKIAYGDRYILENEALFPGRVLRAEPTPADIAAGLPGVFMTLRDTFINVARRDVSGVDLEWQARLGAGAWGQLGSSGLMSYTRRHVEQLTPQTPRLNLLGLEGRTRARARAGLAWSREVWRAGADLNHAGGYRYETQRSVRRAASWTTLDLHGAWSRQGHELTLVVRNLFDRDPPMLDRLAGYDGAVHDPLGRSWVLVWRRAL
jgi:iron complex outermembrane receptor protein